MKALIWVVFAALAAAWTGLAALSVELAEWLLGAAASAPMADAAATVGQAPVPGWLSPWVDPAWVQAAQAFWMDAIAWMELGAPSHSAIMGWITPLVWVGWALGFALLLVLALGGTWLIGRFARGNAVPRTGH